MQKTTSWALVPRQSVGKASYRCPRPSCSMTQTLISPPFLLPLCVCLLSLTTNRGIRSVIPSDKAFSIPLFLNLVHGGTTFTELGVGLGNLRSHLQEQSTRRVNLVRNHFGLFSQCAEGLEWLKEYRKGSTFFVLFCVYYILLTRVCW